jgi:hypothetical protein
LGAITAAAGVAVVVVLVAAPGASTLGVIGAGFNYNPGTHLVHLTVKNNSTGTNGTSVDFTLPAGTSINGLPFESGGGTCTTANTQTGSCTFGHPLSPGTRSATNDTRATSVGINTTGPKPASVTTTEHFADGSSASKPATECTSNIGALPAALPDGTVGTAYSQPFTGTGGPGPFSFAISGGLSPGLTLSPSGLLSGTPTTGGTFSFQLSPIDGNGCGSWPPFSDPSYTLTIHDAPPPAGQPCTCKWLTVRIVPSSLHFGPRNGYAPQGTVDFTVAWKLRCRPGTIIGRGGCYGEYVILAPEHKKGKHPYETALRHGKLHTNMWREECGTGRKCPRVVSGKTSLQLELRTGLDPIARSDESLPILIKRSCRSRKLLGETLSIHFDSAGKIDRAKSKLG